MAIFAKPLTSLFGGFWKAKTFRSRRTPALSALHLSDHELADLNLPASVRSQLEAERAAADRFSLYR